ADHVTIQHQSDVTLRLLIRDPSDETCQTLRFTQDLKVEFIAAHMKVGYDVDLIVRWKFHFSSHSSLLSRGRNFAHSCKSDARLLYVVQCCHVNDVAHARSQTAPTGEFPGDPESFGKRQKKKIKTSTFATGPDRFEPRHLTSSANKIRGSLEPRLQGAFIMAQFNKSFSLDPGVLGPASGQSISITGTTDADVLDAIEHNKEFPRR